MCGIAGYINIDRRPLRDTSVILKMLREQKHRGPDDSGVFAFSLGSGTSSEMSTMETTVINNTFEGFLGFNRLSILDLSRNGHQPMASPDGKVLLTLNGEIYNAFDYKIELQNNGYRFKGTSDTEIVLALYLKYGLDGMLSRLNGMFAIVIVNLSERRIIVIRDRFGIKPMYYLIKNKRYFAFSSELKSFYHLDDLSFELDQEQLDEYLLFRNNIKGTLFKEVMSLEPGQCILFSPIEGITFKRYFNINDYSRPSNKTAEIRNFKTRINDCLKESVSRQLMSDVKLGCQLSGGIDSSLVTLLANKDNKRENFEAVSIIFNDGKFSEEKYINIVADQLGIISHKFLLDSDYYLDNIEKATWHLESPLNHPNTVAIYRLSQCAKEYVTVLLSGEGADEVFGGYERFCELRYPFKLNRLLHEVRKNVLNPNNLFKYFNHEFRAIMANSFMKPDIAYKLKDGFNWEKAVENRISIFSSLDGTIFDRQIKYEITSYLPDLLIRQDKMSMAHSIENRVPFLDNEVVEESFNIPEEFLIQYNLSKGNYEGKYLLKMICANAFSNDFAFRKKMGFGIPVRDFFSNRKFIEYLNDKVLFGIKQRKLFNNELISGWISNVRSLKGDEIEALWLVVAFEIWASSYLSK